MLPDEIGFIFLYVAAFGFSDFLVKKIQDTINRIGVWQNNISVHLIVLIVLILLLNTD